MVRALPDISLRQLEYLVAVAEAPTWSVAADRVGVSPSARSQGRSELERRIGVAQFVPDGRRRVLRPAARPGL
ncbi:MAG: LysR family transcriptional regulator, partial [Ilumatobacter fluminis]